MASRLSQSKSFRNYYLLSMKYPMAKLLHLMCHMSYSRFLSLCRILEVVSMSYHEYLINLVCRTSGVLHPNLNPGPASSVLCHDLNPEPTCCSHTL